MGDTHDHPFPGPKQMAMMEERHLAEADRHIADAERRITSQEQRLAEMRQAGEDTSDGVRLLDNLRRTLEQMHVHRRMIVEALQRP